MKLDRSDISLLCLISFLWHSSFRKDSNMRTWMVQKYPKTICKILCSQYVCFTNKFLFHYLKIKSNSSAHNIYTLCFLSKENWKMETLQNLIKQ